MDDKLNEIKQFFFEEKSELPLVLHDVDLKEKQNGVTGKIIQILKYRTTIYPINGYYKNVIRVIE